MYESDPTSPGAMAQDAANLCAARMSAASLASAAIMDSRRRGQRQGLLPLRRRQPWQKAVPALGSAMASMHVRQSAQARGSCLQSQEVCV